MTKSHGAVLTFEEFLDDFEQEAQNAKDSRIVAQSMVISANYVGNRILSIFSKTDNSNEKYFYFDHYSKLTAGYVINAFYLLNPFTYKQAKKNLDKISHLISLLEEQGVHTRELNVNNPFFVSFFPFLGRNHIKGTYITNKKESIFYIQSANFERGPTKTYDLIIKTTGDVAEKLITAFDEIDNNPPEKDYTKEITPEITLFVDSGIPNQSLILEKGNELLLKATESIELCSLFYPDGRIAKTLSEKTKEWKNDSTKTLTIVASWLPFILRPIFSVYLASYMVQVVCFLTAKFSGFSFPTILKPFVMHPKYLLVDNKFLFFGSHNLSQKGVQAGTREMQLLITNPEIIKNAHEQFEKIKAV